MVDVILASPNSSSWQQLERDYQSLVPPGGAFAAAPDAPFALAALDGYRHGEESAAAALHLAQHTCRARQDTNIGPCWDVVLVWNLGVTPLVAATELPFEEGAVVAPWREANSWELPSTANTVTARQVMVEYILQ